MLDRLKRTFKDRDTYVAYIASICLPILFWYEYSKDNLETWKGWLSLIMAIVVSGMFILLFMVTILDVVFDVPVEKSERVMHALFNSFLASISTIIVFLIGIGILFYFVGWLVSIPAWATVIIILLVMLLIRG